MAGNIYRYLAEDHRRMEALLARAAEESGSAGLAAYSEFRAALLRHIGMEETILIPAARRARGGERLPMADRLHLDHSALAALLVPPPTVEILAVIRAILSCHNALEEGEGGFYETCERLAENDQGALLEKLRQFPIPRLRPNVPGTAVMAAARRSLAKAGYDWDDLVSRGDAEQ